MALYLPTFSKFFNSRESFLRHFSALNLPVVMRKIVPILHGQARGRLRELARLRAREMFDPPTTPSNHRDFRVCEPSHCGLAHSPHQQDWLQVASVWVCTRMRIDWVSVPDAPVDAHASTARGTRPHRPPLRLTNAPASEIHISLGAPASRDL